MEPGMSAAPAEIVGWLLRPETRALSYEELVSSLCERLVVRGVPLWRVSTSQRTLHPEVFVRNIQWHRGGGVRSAVQPREIIDQPRYTDSPVAQVHRGAAAIRRRLAGPGAAVDYPICRDLAAEGGTDYLIQPLEYSWGRDFVSWATDRAGGFSDGDLAVLEEVAPALAIVSELASSYFATRSLLEVYLGKNAAGEVLAGAVTRGAGKALRAAIYFCDLRGFTALTDRRPPAEVIALLDRYFEAIVGPVSEHGGEVLKFIGDAVLAVFPATGGDDRAACGRALLAARRALEDTGSLRPSGGGSRLEFGVALHLGEVVYGNIGARDRLDFTVIGPAVNEAARVESLCRPLGASLLLTAAFAAACPDAPLRSLGHQELRGVSEPQEIFTLGW
jgi:adenylate cyclase